MRFGQIGVPVTVASRMSINVNLVSQLLLAFLKIES